MQDTFLVAWSEVSRLRQPGRLRPWLFAVARNECHRRLRTGVRATPAGAMDDTVQLAAVTEQAELRAMVAAALAGLDPVEREISELNLRHGLGGADLAAVLGVPARQAHALAARARARSGEFAAQVADGRFCTPAQPRDAARHADGARAAERHAAPDRRLGHRFLPGRGGPSRPGGRTGGAVRRGRVPGTAREAGDASLAGGSRAGGRRGRRGLGLARQRHVLRQLRLCLQQPAAFSSRYRPGIHIHPAVSIHSIRTFQARERRCVRVMRPRRSCLPLCSRLRPRTRPPRRIRLLRRTRLRPRIRLLRRIRLRPTHSATPTPTPTTPTPTPTTPAPPTGG